MSTPPTGTVTFLFTDIEGSTRLWEERPDEMRAALAEHDALVRAAIDAHGGYVFSTGGDGFAAAFSRAHDAVDAARNAQAALADHPLIRVRMGIHTGEVQERDGDYFGPAVNRTARLMAVGHGGQVLVSSITHALLPTAVVLIDLGEHRLRDLSSTERLFQLGLDSFPPLRTMDAFPGNLPRQLTSFVGRERELSQLVEMLGSSRLVTLTGPGGVGKTRLAVQIAAELLPRYADGAWFVSLAELAEPSLVAVSVASTLGVSERAGESMIATLAAWAARRSALIVIDNCEHLLESVAALVAALLQAGGGVTVVATSREPLAVAGEQIAPVSPLALPTTTHGTEPVMELFEQRARAVRPGFALDDSNLATVVEICRLLDGIPLAVELAAARVRAMGPHDIARRLDQRFRELGGSDRAAPLRHRTLDAVFRWSYDLLLPDEQRVFERLGVFFGSFDLDAAEAVVSGDDIDRWSVLERIVALVDKSLVIYEDTAQAARYRLLETTRQFALELLDERSERESIRRRHLGYYRGLVDDLRADLWGADDLAAVAQLEREQANVRGALRASTNLDPVDAFEQFVEALWPWWQIKMIDAEQWYSEALMRPWSDFALRVRTLSEASFVSVNMGPLERALHLAQASIDFAAQRGLSAPIGQASAAIATFMLGRHDDALHHAVQALDTAHEVGDTYVRAYTLMCTASLIGTARLDLPGIAAAEEALSLAEHVGSYYLRAQATSALGFNLLYEDPPRAAALLEQSFHMQQNFGMQQYHANNGQFLGILAGRRGDLRSAAQWFDTALRAGVDLAPSFIPQTLNSIVGCFRRSHPDDATRLLGGLLTLRAESHRAGSTGEARAETRWRAELEEQLGDAFESLLEEGRALDRETLVAETLAFLERVQTVTSSS